MFIKSSWYQQLDMLTKSFKHTGDVNDLLLMNNLIVNDGKPSSSDISTISEEHEYLWTFVNNNFLINKLHIM